MAENDCSTCAYRTDMAPLKYKGSGHKKILVIGSAPTLMDMISGSYGASKEYQFFSSAFIEAGRSLQSDCWYTTVFGCPSKKLASQKEYDACSARLAYIIRKLQPKAIILLGKTPYYGVLKKRIAVGRMTNTTYLDLVGDTIPLEDMNAWVCPVWGLSDLMYKKTYEEGTQSKSLWDKDSASHVLLSQYINNAYLQATRPVPVFKPVIRTTVNKEQAIAICDKAKSWEICAFDYETDCKKPYNKGKIYYASISDGKVGYSFPFFEDKQFRGAWERLMLSDVPKIAHNNAFEAVWTKVVCGYWPNNWCWDTMLGMHCIHNKKPTNLKYCVFRDFGIIGYDTGADEYIMSSTADNKKYGSYALNRIDEADPDEIMKYNAQDSLYTAWLYPIQRKQLSSFRMKGMRLLVETQTTFAKMSYNGIKVNEGNFAAVQKDLLDKTNTIMEELMADPIVAKWDGDKPINLGSSKQLSHLLFDIMGKKPLAYTKTKAPSTDKETLKKMGMPFLDKLLTYREWKKMANTYVDGWKRETINGYIHANLMLNTVDTFRSSATTPNIQNTYKRDKAKKKVVRSLVCPRRGHRLAEYDYKSLEVMINGDHSKDPSLIRYCTDPSTDMHRDGAADVLMMAHDEVKGEWRGCLKGLYTFAEFYGSFYKQVAKGVWEWLQGVPELLTHLSTKGISNYTQFEAHMEKCEKTLWGVRFRVHDAWRKAQYNEYQRCGYLESYTGFRLNGLMSRNNSFNGAVQGDGFHCLAWYINKLQKKFEELQLNSLIINEIHDSVVIDIDPAEEDIVDYWVWQYGVKAVMEHYSWLKIPLQIEKERSEIDGTWADMTNCGYITGERMCA